MSRPEHPVDRTAFGVVSREQAEEEDRQYWHSRTPGQRLLAMKYLRQLNNGDAASARLQYVFETVRREAS